LCWVIFDLWLEILGGESLHTQKERRHQATQSPLPGHQRRQVWLVRAIIDANYPSRRCCRKHGFGCNHAMINGRASVHRFANGKPGDSTTHHDSATAE
jgi:hypothetical protein